MREPRIAALHTMPHKPGHPAHTSAEDNRATVETMFAFGVSKYSATEKSVSHHGLLQEDRHC
jgi:hypothetical protein